MTTPVKVKREVEKMSKSLVQCGESRFIFAKNMEQMLYVCLKCF